MFGAIIHSKDPHRVHLCELVIQYALGDEAIKLAANVLISPGSQEPIYMTHRGNLESVRLASLEDWVGDGGEVPYSHIFRNIVDKRAEISEDVTADVRIIQTEEPHVSNLSYKADLLSDQEAIREMFTHNYDPNVRRNRPFSLIRVGPFPETDSIYLFRVEAVMASETAREQGMVIEDPSTAARAYRCYGFVKHQLSTTVIPCIPSSQYGEHYVDDAFAFQLMTEHMHELRPVMYSIVGLSNPELSARTVHSLDLRGNLTDLSSHVSRGVYEHDFFEQIPGQKIHWYITKEGKGPEDVFLHLQGPIAIHEGK